MRSITYVFVATTLIAGLGVSGCASGSDPSRDRERFANKGTGSVIIGAAWPWSARPDLLYGQGLQLAVEQVNAEGGINGRKLVLRQVDDGGMTDRARLVAQELADDPKVVAVIGHHQSHVTAAAAPIYELAGLVLISATSTIPAMPSQHYRYVFQTPFTGVDVGRSMANFALGRGCRRLAVYYSRDDHGRDLANAFEEYATAQGGQLVARESADPTVPSTALGVTRVVTNWREQVIDAVFLATPHKPAVALAIELRKSGFRGPLLGSDALGAPGFISSGSQHVEGTVFATSFSEDTPSKDVHNFTQAFQQRFGKQPDETAALGYDAVRVLVHAMRASASVAPSKVADALRGVRGWAGVTGVFTFSPAGTRTDATVNTAIIRGGRSQALVDPESAPTCSAGPVTAATW